MNRGRAIQPYRECDYCGNPLPTLRHPKAKYCDGTCRQRDRYAREHEVNGVKCLDCGKIFTRVGSHVVQVHGYESTAEYLKEHGLMAKETHTEEYAHKMRDMITYRATDNLPLGAENRFRKGGHHAENLHNFWENRKKKEGYKKLGKTLDNRRT